jgi:rifampicin phosphotransferase
MYNRTGRRRPLTRMPSRRAATGSASLGLVPLAQASTRHAGAKAGTLGRLRRLGFPVPDGFVILPAAAARSAGVAHGPADVALRRAVASALGRLGARRVAVRSSASVEDRPGRSAAGLFHTSLDVPATPTAVLRAAAACVASRRAPHVAAYLRGDAARLRLAVIVQPMVRGARGVLFTRDPDAPAHMRIEVVQADGFVTSAVWRRAAPPAAEPQATLSRLALAAEQALGGPLDIEFVLGPTGPVLLQARPAPRPRAGHASWRPSPAVRGRTLVFDREHNPAPLSPAHQDLVARLDARGLGGGHLCVIDGYLYATEEALRPRPQADLAALWRRLQPRWARELRVAEVAPPTSVRAALVAFERFYASYARELQPALRQARRELLARVPAPVAAALSATARTATTRRDEALWRLARLAEPRRGVALRRLLRRYGSLAPTWDVAVPTFAEDPAPLLAALGALARERRGPEARRRAAPCPAGVGGRDVAQARRVASIAEEDDVYFARALFQLRRALLGRGARLVACGALVRRDDVFLLPLLPEPRVRVRLRDRVTVVRARLEAQRRTEPPTRIVQGVPQWDRPRGALRGVGCGGRARGPVYRHLGAATPRGVPGGAVLVCATLLPSWTFVLPHLAAVVAEEGGALSHGAILAREYGVPAVFGVRGALARLGDGDEVVVDGAGGRIWPATPARRRR